MAALVRQAALLTDELSPQEQAYISNVLSVAQAHVDSSEAFYRSESLRMCQLSGVIHRLSRREGRVRDWIEDVRRAAAVQSEISALQRLKGRLAGLRSQYENEVSALVSKIGTDETLLRLLGGTHSSCLRSDVSRALAQLEVLEESFDRRFALALSLVASQTPEMPENCDAEDHLAPPGQALGGGRPLISVTKAKMDFALLRIPLQLRDFPRLPQLDHASMAGIQRRLEAARLFVQRYQSFPVHAPEDAHTPLVADMLCAARAFVAFATRQIETAAEELVQRSHFDEAVDPMEVLDAFVQFDVDHDGFLDSEQAECLLVSIGLNASPTQMQSLFGDRDRIDASGLCHWLRESRSHERSLDTLCRSLRDLADGSYFISDAVLTEALGSRTATLLSECLLRSGDLLRIDRESVGHAITVLESS